eukprot:1396145-Amphidinium_carterae.1
MIGQGFAGRTLLSFAKCFAFHTYHQHSEPFNAGIGASTQVQMESFNVTCHDDQMKTWVALCKRFVSSYEVFLVILHKATGYGKPAWINACGWPTQPSDGWSDQSCRRATEYQA